MGKDETLATRHCVRCERDLPEDAFGTRVMSGQTSNQPEFLMASPCCEECKSDRRASDLYTNLRSLS